MMSVSDLWCIVALKQNELQQIRLVLCCQSNYTDKFICKVLLWAKQIILEGHEIQKLKVRFLFETWK